MPVTVWVTVPVLTTPSPFQSFWMVNPVVEMPARAENGAAPPPQVGQ